MCCEHATKRVYLFNICTIALKIYILYSVQLFGYVWCVYAGRWYYFSAVFSHLIYVYFVVLLFFFSQFFFRCSLRRRTANRTYLTEIGYIYARFNLPHKSVLASAHEWVSVQLFYTDFIALFRTLLIFSMIRIKQPIHTQTQTHAYRDKREK